MDKKKIFFEKFEDDFKSFHEERHRRHRHEDKHKHHHRFDVNMVTKMVTSKEDLVAYVNEKGEQGHKIDVFKIEDGLYKVVVLEHKKHDCECKEDTDIEVEVEIEKE